MDSNPPRSVNSTTCRATDGIKVYEKQSWDDKRIAKWRGGQRLVPDRLAAPQIDGKSGSYKCQWQKRHIHIGRGKIDREVSYNQFELVQCDHDRPKNLLITRVALGHSRLCHDRDIYGILRASTSTTPAASSASTTPAECTISAACAGKGRCQTRQYNEREK